MGRTTPTVRQKMEIIAQKYGRMRSIMRAEDVEIFDRIMLMGRKHSPEISMAGIDPETGFLMSVILEMMKLFRQGEEEE
ncbi:hypothetical protein IX51_02595 [uncultured archaeon]|nr:hypothetical protein IX51_02595 [uncultured archaeon]